ncbi:hypothetical protein CJ739_1834 [Mariniflexile rhizosphaerae]|uniref:hypothetical protein n=1 Tax=unclassified Mariniflexile TaxID=2643887 RepID=UPI000CC11178|nr:hypothetical protein [Mariniflexile sp. TRM1-10]AXP80919.1 hypothetical protein CJ739_1834 [Mariniflexile sp. TRM1-10]PLB20006.1 MAG: hypothetical protein TRG1_1270 [Flavobacteriaceae bacterium FS1-H7996/R]
MSERLKIKFTGNEIDPSKVTANEFAKIVASYENALLSVANKINPARKGIDFISVVNVKHESLTIEAEPHTIQIKEAANEINTAIKQNRVNRLPYETIENLMVFQSFVNKYKCKAILNGIEGVETAEITVDSDIKITDSLYFKGETTIYGKIIRIGGSKPRVRIQIDNGNYISVETSSKNAKELSPNLYNRIGIKGIGKWKKENNELVEIKAKSFVVISDLPLTEKLKGLSNLLSKYWINIDNPDDYITSLRG